MRTKISKVISKLDNLMKLLEEIGYPTEDDTFFLHDLPEKHTDIKKLISDICGDMSTIFIIQKGQNAGQPDFLRHGLLENMSNGKYRITKGESDTWGWLSAILHTPRGSIVYG